LRPEIRFPWIEQSAGVGFRSVLGEDAQEVEDRRRGHRLAGVETRDRRAGRDPLAGLTLRRCNRRLAVLRPPGEEKEAVVESDRRERWSPPAAGEDQPRSVEAQVEGGEHLGEPAFLRQHRTTQRDGISGRSAGGEQQAGLLEQLAQSAGDDARCEVGVVRRSPLGGRRRPRQRIGMQRFARDRQVRVGAIESAAREGVPAGHERQRPPALDPVDLELAVAAPPRHDRGRRPWWAGGGQASARRDQNLLVEPPGELFAGDHG
jgi:hypothetical protein